MFFFQLSLVDIKETFYNGYKEIISNLVQLLRSHVVSLMTTDRKGQNAGFGYAAERQFHGSAYYNSRIHVSNRNKGPDVVSMLKSK